MSKKLQYILEGVLVVVLLILYSVFVVIPDYKKSQGSSDGFIESNRYDNMIEIRIPSKLDIGFVLDKEGKIYHLFFFDKNATTLYNKNIENLSIQKGLEKVVPIIAENGFISNGDSVVITRNNDHFHEDFENAWNQLMQEQSISLETSFVVVPLKDRVLEIGVEEESTSSLLLNLDFYSKENLRDIKSPTTSSVLNEKTSGLYADNIFLKIEEYVLRNGIVTLDRYNTELVLSLIPAEESLRYYPTTRSWFQVEEGKITAFIEFQENEESYGFCYHGSVEAREKGECTS